MSRENQLHEESFQSVESSEEEEYYDEEEAPVEEQAQSQLPEVAVVAPAGKKSGGIKSKIKNVFKGLF